MQHGLIKSNIDNNTYIVSTSGTITDYGSAVQPGSLGWILTQIGSSRAKVLFPGNFTYTFLTNVTVNSNIKIEVEHGALFSGSVTLLFNGEFKGPRSQIFSSTITAIWAEGATLFPQWWYSGVGNYGTALQYCFTAAAATFGTTVDLGSYTYTITVDGLCVANTQRLTIKGNRAVLSYIASTGYALRVIGCSYCTFEGFTINYSATANGMHVSALTTNCIYNTFSYLTFNGSSRGAAGTTPYRASLIFEGLSNTWNIYGNRVSNCMFYSNTTGIAIYGAGSKVPYATSIDESNLFSDFWRGIFVYTGGATISHCNFSGTFMNSAGTGPSAYVTGVYLEGNTTFNHVKITGNLSTYAYPYTLTTDTGANTIRVSGYFPIKGYNGSIYRGENYNDIQESFLYTRPASYLYNRTGAYSLEVGQTVNGSIDGVTSLNFPIYADNGMYKIYLIITVTATSWPGLFFIPNASYYSGEFISRTMLLHDNPFPFNPSVVGYPTVGAGTQWYMMNFVDAVENRPGSAFALDCFGENTGTIPSSYPVTAELTAITFPTAKQLYGTTTVPYGPAVHGCFWNNNYTNWSSLGAVTMQDYATMYGYWIVTRLF